MAADWAVDGHRLQGSQVGFQASPNHGGGFAEGLPDTIVIHYTAGASLESSVKTLGNPTAKASAHVVVGREGEVVQLVPFDTVAWHAGASSWNGRNGLNRYSIGIEIDNAGVLQASGNDFVSWFGRHYPADQVVTATHRNEARPRYWHLYSEAQITAVFELCALLIRHYGIRDILGHEEIAPSRKTDPGPAFPLDTLRSRLLGSGRSEDGPDDSAAAVTTSACAAVPAEPAGVVTASALNIRMRPGIASPLAGAALPLGTVVTVHDENNGWFEVSTRTRLRGWVKAEYIRS